MKLNQPLRHSALLILVILISGCSLVELEQPGPGENIVPPVGLPQTSEAFMEALAGTEQGLTWSALTFELEGMNGFQFCRLDDTFSFFSDGTYRYDGGDVLCGAEDDTRIKTGTWELDFPNSKIIFDVGTSLEYEATVTGIQDGRIQLIGQVQIFGQSFDISGIYETEQ